MMGTVAAISICALLAQAGFAQPGADRTYTGYYTGVIIPTPQEVTYSPDAWSLPTDDVIPVVVGADATDAERLGAREIVNRIAHLGGRAEVVGEADLPRDCQLVFSVGALVGSHVIASGGVEVPAQPEGYAIACRQEDSGRRAVVCLGADPTGCYFAAQSLVQLFERAEGGPVFHPVTVRDWPVFSLRSFKVGGSPGMDTASGRMAQWAPSAKFNCYNICYTTVGRDKWVDPSAEYTEYIARVTEYLVARGLDTMPFVNPYYLWDEHIEVTDPGDLEKLFAACRLGPEAGGTRVMLCLDDFASEQDRAGPKLYHVRSERDQAKYGDDLGALNVDMINDLDRRLKQAYPDVKLYVVLPYYWIPGGSHREAGEADLRTIGAGIDEGVRIVWTGPRVRSGTITAEDLAHYQALVGQTVMLWDNTLYARHNPPHFFLDEWVTTFPEDFAATSSGEVHLNAGSGEAYKAGLFAAADRLWNPEAYDPEQAMRNGVAAVIGPKAVDAALEFRDLYYDMYDNISTALGKPAKLLALLENAQARPLDAEDLGEIRRALDRMKQLRDEIARLTDNEGFVAEVSSHYDQQAGYEAVLARLEALPPLTEVEGRNILVNPGAEEGEDAPTGWGSYSGAGGMRLTRDESQPHSGRASALLEATEWYQMPRGNWINVAAMVTGSNGFVAGDAPEVAPFSKYYFRCWMRGDLPKVRVALQCWAGDGASGDRRNAVGEVKMIELTDEWQLVETSFITPVDATCAAVKIGPQAYEADGAGLGGVWIDDVYLGRAKPGDQE
jgi:hypothetical protein